LLLGSTTKTVRKEALWALSNVTAGNEQQIGAIIGRESLLAKIFTLTQTDSDEVSSV
jgi:hypothetical protein